MKNFAIYLGIAALAMVSCIRQEEDFRPLAQDNVIFYASFEQPAGADTKVYATEELYLRWHAEDQLSIFNKITYNQPYQFTGNTGDNAGGFRKVETDAFVTGNPISHIVAVYPYQKRTVINENAVLTVTLPALQAYAQNTFGPGANTMVSVSSDNILQFKNVGGMLRLRMYGENIAVSSITLKGNGGEKLAGKARISMPNGGVPVVEMDQDATDEITLFFETPVQLGTTSDTCTDFWMVIPPTTFSQGFSITVKDKRGRVFEKSTDKSVEIPRSTLVTMAAYEVVPVGPEGVTDLSEMQTANCYIVEGEGRYSFDATTMGNGTDGMNLNEYVHTASAHIDPKKVYVLWQDAEIVSDVSLQDGRVYFSANEGKGNALIAVTDENDVVLWSWHIWATDKPAEIQLTTATHTFMDRNLGAVSCEPGSELSNGLFYQWGRKDPLHPDFSEVTEKPVPLTVEYLIQNPTAIPQGNTTEWVRTQTGLLNVGLWGNPNGTASLATYKTIYDPCPAGYTIPADDTWYEYASLYNSDHRYYSLYDPSIVISSVQGGISASKEGMTLYYPLIVPLFQDSSSGGYYYRNAFYDNGNVSCLVINDYDKSVHPDYSVMAEKAVSIRCIKEQAYDILPPAVVTQKAQNVRIHDLLLVGEVSYNGNTPITKTGFVWGLSPSEMNHRIENPRPQTSFTAQLEDLPYLSTIYYRAFAENAAGISYGNIVLESLPSVEDYSEELLRVTGKMMTSQYLSTQGLNGEGVIKTWYGNHGNDLQRTNQSGWANMWNHTMHEDVNSIYLKYPWYYYYKLIDGANRVMETLDSENVSNARTQFNRAQALVFRAHAYTMLMQLYAYRWQDSGNGSSDGVMLRLDTSSGELPLSSQLECYNQIYADCDQAISLFNACGLDRESYEFYKPNRNVAYAVKTRAALVREDWTTVAECAPYARAGNPLMSKSQYMDGGFSDENDEWIWGVYESQDQTIYYYSFFAYQASNASSSMQRTYPLAISKELYDQIPTTDARRKMWLEPTAAEAAELNAAGRSTKTLYKRAFAEYGDKLYSTSLVYQYMQFKFLATFMPGGGSFNIYRSAEMYLAEAEALCHLGGQDAKVQSLLNELNQNLDPSYNCTKTGEDLLTEVKLYRRIDLWGEGFDWYDYKRWNQPIVRHNKADGGSFNDAFAVTINVEDGNRWTWMIPTDSEWRFPTYN